MHLKKEFSEFKKLLTKDEISAIQFWLGIGYDSIRSYQLTGEGDEKTIQYEQYLNSALDKAVICEKTVYRGLAA